MEPARVASTDSVAPSAPATPTGDFDPIQLLRSVESGDVQITLPATSGEYGKGIEAFTVRPGTTLTITVKVRDGRLVPGITKIAIEPKLDNMLWIETKSFELTPDGKIVARLDGLAGLYDPEMTASMLKVERLPLDMPGLYDLVTKQAKVMAAQAAEFSAGKNGAELIDTSKIRMKLSNCVLAPGVLTLPDPSINVVVGGTPPSPCTCANWAPRE
jgi:hypothetical protein